jgi:hypothetical protein
MSSRLHYRAVQLPQRDTKEPTEHLEHASNGKHHGQSNQQNREWHQQGDAGRTSEGDEPLNDRPLCQHRSRDVETPVGAISVSRIRRGERKFMSESADYWIRTSGARIPGWRIARGKGICEDIVDCALAGKTLTSTAELVGRTVDTYGDRRDRGTSVPICD